MITDLKKVLTDNIPNNIHNKTIVKEMFAVLDASGIFGDSCDGKMNIKK